MTRSAGRSRIETAYRWSITAQERQTPTSTNPSIPLDYPTELGQVHFLALSRLREQASEVAHGER